MPNSKTVAHVLFEAGVEFPPELLRSNRHRVTEEHAKIIHAFYHIGAKPSRARWHLISDEKERETEEIADAPTFAVVNMPATAHKARFESKLRKLVGQYRGIVVVVEAKQYNDPRIRSALSADDFEVIIKENDAAPELRTIQHILSGFIMKRLHEPFEYPVLDVHALPPEPPPADPLDLSARLRNPRTGRLDANRISELLGITQTDLARLCGVTKQSLNKTPASAGIQDKLQPLEEVAQALLWCGGSEPKLRAWLNRPNPDFPQFEGRTPSPMDLILGGHAPLVARKVHNLRTGHPS